MGFRVRVRVSVRVSVSVRVRVRFFSVRICYGFVGFRFLGFIVHLRPRAGYI